MSWASGVGVDVKDSGSANEIGGTRSQDGKRLIDCSERSKQQTWSEKKLKYT